MSKSIEQLQAELAETNAKIEQNAVDLASVQANRSELEADIETLKAKLAEEQKPKDKVGDYGLSRMKRGGFFIAEDRKHGLLWNSSGSSDSTVISEVKETTCVPDNFIHLGNIFDDIAALQEDVTEFEVPETDDEWGIKVDIDDEHEQVQLRVVYSSGVEDREQGLSFRFGQLSALILNLRKMEATQKRRQK